MLFGLRERERERDFISENLLQSIVQQTTLTKAPFSLSLKLTHSHTHPLTHTHSFTLLRTHPYTHKHTLTPKHTFCVLCVSYFAYDRQAIVCQLSLTVWLLTSRSKLEIQIQSKRNIPRVLNNKITFSYLRRDVN